MSSTSHNILLIYVEYRTTLLLATVPAWVPGSQQDANEFLLSIYQILD